MSDELISPIVPVTDALAGLVETAEPIEVMLPEEVDSWPPAASQIPPSPWPPAPLQPIEPPWTQPFQTQPFQTQPPQAGAADASQFSPEVPALRKGRNSAPRFLQGVVVGAVVGALVAGAIVWNGRDGTGNSAGKGNESSTANGSRNGSVISRPGDIQEILTKIEPATVKVEAKVSASSEFDQPGDSVGSGFVVESDGIIVTNSHVVAGAEEIQVVFDSGETMTAEILGRDPGADLAVLKVEAKGLPTAELGDSTALQVGDDVIAIGNALALEGGPTVTRGIVSALDRTIETEDGGLLTELIQTDAAINPGNSGGPLVNSAGQVVGINTAIADPQDFQNLGFAISIAHAQPFIEDLKLGERLVRPLMGVMSQTVDEQAVDEFGLKVETGALIAEVVDGSPADEAGVKAGDVVVKFDDIKITSAQELTEAVRASAPGRKAVAVIDRFGEKLTLEMTLGERLGTDK